MSKILLTIPNLKNCIFGAVSIVKYIDKRMWMYSCYGITFDRAGLWKLDYNFARNIVNDRTSSHTDNSNHFFSARWRSNTDKKNVEFPNSFSLGSISNRFGTTESREVSYDFSVYYNSIYKSEILNIYEHLNANNNMV